MKSFTEGLLDILLVLFRQVVTVGAQSDHNTDKLVKLSLHLGVDLSLIDSRGQCLSHLFTRPVEVPVNVHREHLNTVLKRFAIIALLSVLMCQQPVVESVLSLGQVPLVDALFI